MKILHMLTFLLVAIGALNWGLVGAFDWNLVHAALGAAPMLEKIVYVLVGLAAIYEVLMHPAMCRLCSSETKATTR